MNDTKLEKLFDALLAREFLAPVAVGVFVVSLIVIGFYVVTKIRTNSSDQHHDTSGMLTNFRELHSEGGLTDDEYREIKTQIAGRMTEELKNSEETG